MNNKGSLIPIALITILVGSGLRLSLPAASGDSGTSEQRPSGSSSPKSSVEAAQSNRDDQPDTLDVVAESLGVETGKDQLRKRAVESVEVLRSRDKSAEWPDAIRFLQEFFRLAIRKDAPKLDEARTAAGKLADSSDPPPSAVQAIEQFLDRYFNEDALRIDHPTDEAKLLAEDFSRLDTEPLVIALLRRAAHDQNITVRFLVATLPDAVDSHAGWQFDPMLDAIQQAITADDYLLDRFHLPDSDVERDSRASADRQRRRVHEREPGVVVFRKHREQGKENAGLLVLLLVQESPTAGVHQAAFVGALSLINKWNASTQGGAASPEGDDHVFRILGPTFSGSSQSLARILRALSSTTLRGARVRLVSGSATNRQNKRTLEGAIPDRVRFQATVQPDDHLLCSQAKYLEKAGWSRPVAVLFETNTDYGRQIGERLGKRCFERESRGATPASEFGVIQLPFPMNISRLRVTAQSVKPGAPDPWAMPSRFRPLAMEESGNPTDQLPVLSPRTTASYMELALAGLLQTLGRESIGTVALMATDSRDKLFLAQQISQYSPNVSIFTAESDSLYIHPDYSSYLRGTLVASTYGLFNANQRWSYPYEGTSSRLQFATGSAQSGRETWKRLMNAAFFIAAQLQLESGSEIQRRNQVGPAAPKGSAEAGHLATDAVASSRAVDQLADAPSNDREEVVAMSLVFVIRDALARLGHNLAFITGGVLLVFCSHTLFPFEARHRLQALAWTYVGLTFAGLLTVIMQIKRDEILGRVASVTPGVRTTWDASFVLKLAVFGLLPLLTLFAAQFPQVGGTLLRWLEPVQKVLP